MDTADTIAAISSAIGPAARMIVRISGPAAQQIASSIAPPAHLTAGCTERRELQLRSFHVPAWLYFFQAPHSYTSEDVVEFHIPGNPLLARILLDELIVLGVRHAQPGEFTARAFFNGRMNLSEAEGVAATVAAQNERELRAARQLLAGELSRRLNPIIESLADSLALIEVGIDFSEEDVTFLPQTEVRSRIERADDALEKLLGESARFEALSHEPQIVLVGRPNAGKSTLLNALAREDRAVVSADAGTTRDAIWSHLRLRRGTVRLIDVAGLADGPSDEIGDKMQRAARRAVETADIVVLVCDVTDMLPAPLLPVAANLTVFTKIDLIDTDRPDGVSALTGQNLDRLRERLDSIAFGQPIGGATLALNARHIESIDEARTSLARAVEAADHAGPEVVAMELRESIDCLGRISGSVTPDDLLGRIFGSFCIGK